MSEFQLFGITLTTWLITSVIALSIWLATRRPSNLPPGPRFTLPLLGHLLFMGGDPLCFFKRMRQKYGDIFHIYLGTRLVIVLNGYDVIHDALVKHHDVFSERAQMFVTDLYEGKGIAFSSGTTWKEQRRFAIETLRSFGFGKNILQEKISEEVFQFKEAVSQQKGQPFDMKIFLHTAVSNITCNMVFGKRFDYGDTKFHHHLENMETFLEYLGCTMLLNYIPILKHMPGDLFDSKAALGARDEVYKDLIGQSIQDHLANFDPDRPSEDYIDAYIKEWKRLQTAGKPTTLNDQNLVRSISDLFGGGSDTVSNAVRWAIIYLLHYPDMQNKLHDEIRDVIGMKTPIFDDRAKMPYTEAFLMEVLRHSPIVPLGISRTVCNDLNFRGFTIPKGTIIIAQLESSLKDPSVWDKPEVFNPDRFLRDGQVFKIKEHIAFSLGRRNCPGKYVAKMTYFLFVVTLLQHFCLELDDETSPPPDMKGILGLAYFPKPFSLRAIPRR